MREGCIPVVRKWGLKYNDNNNNNNNNNEQTNKKVNLNKIT